MNEPELSARMKMADRPVLRSRLVRTFGTATTSILAATIATWFVIPTFGGRAPIGIFLLAITIEATTVGLFPGLIATGLSLLAAHIFFGDALSLVLEQNSLLIVLMIAGIVASLLGSRIYQTNLALRQAKTELWAANKKLAQYAQLLAGQNGETSSAGAKPYSAVLQ